eukprot:8548282-Lingulodinium_polyedra.AAC.1
MLNSVEVESRYYGLALNRAKCNAITINKDNKVTFEDGTPLERVTSSKYLGSILTEDAKNTEEIQHRIGEARKAVKALDKFWTKA